MYGWLWRHLPGPLAVRLLVAALALTGVVVALFTVVFPWLETVIPLDGTGDSVLDDARTR
jgi:hypothetical protein